MQILIYILIALSAVGLASTWFILDDSKQEQNPAPTQEQSVTTETNETAVIHEEKPVTQTVPTSSAHTLSLANSELTEVPNDVFSRTDIEVLDLSNNLLTGALQAEVRNLSHLKVLDLSDNQFTGVPAEVGQLQNLEVLDLSNNKLTGLPYELGNLSKLKTLNLSGNAYAEADLVIIKKSLPSITVIITE
jgi:Leucine-rich repeat (LRR) protein